MTSSAVLGFIFAFGVLPYVVSSSVAIHNGNEAELSRTISQKDLAHALYFFIDRIEKDFSESKAIDYEGLRKSSFYKRNIKYIRRAFKSIEPKHFPEEERKSLFINTYNILFLESILDLPEMPESVLKDDPEFESRNGFTIGNWNYTLASIKHGVLRDNSRDVFTEEVYFKPVMKKLISVKKDPRTIFTLFQASESGPPLKPYSSENLEEQMNSATLAMCNEGVRIEDDSSVVLNEIFETYMKDFATSKDGLLRWLSKCVGDTDKKIALYFAAIDDTFLDYSFKPFPSRVPIKKVNNSEEKKLEVEVYIESLCPDTHTFFIDQLEPSYADIKRIINLQLITFGKASVITKEDGNGLEFECQHGPVECLGNKIMSCVVEYFPVDVQVQFLTCLMATPSLKKGVRECGVKIDVPVAQLEECYKTPEGSNILYKNGLKTLELNPQLFFVPTIVINKDYNSSTIQLGIRHFSSFICKTFMSKFGNDHGISTPSGCKVKIDVYIESLSTETHAFFQDQLKPTYLRVGDSMDLEIIPFGRTSISNDENKAEISSRMKCLRGPLECYGNIVMSCIVKHLPIEAQVRVLSCMMSKKVPALKGKDCMSQEGLGWTPVDTCAEGTEGTQVILLNERKTKALDPSGNSFPIVTVNKIQNSTFTEWALNDLTALVCDSFLISSDFESRVKLPKGCPVRIEIYLEMLCPDTKRFFLKVFHPTWKSIRPLIDLHIVPFGKANVWLSNEGQDYEFECQYGPLECKGNKILSCIVVYLPVDLQVDLIACMLEARSSSNAGEECAAQLKIAWDPIKECFTSREGAELLFQNGVRTMKLKPTFFFVPTITINNYYDEEQLQKTLTDLKSEICRQYQEPFKQSSKVLTPKGCKLEMDVYIIGISGESKGFFLRQLIPTWEKLERAVSLKIYPIGGNFGKQLPVSELEKRCRKNEECRSDLVFACATKYFEAADQVKFIGCSLRSNKSDIDSKKKCAEEHFLSWDLISKCYASSEGVAIVEENLRRTNALTPSFHSVPTVLINGYYDKHELMQSKRGLQSQVCNAFYDPSSSEKWKPEGCPVYLEVFMASLCPDTKRYFLQQVKPTWEELSSIIDIKIIPFGKASAKLINPDTEEYEFKCQHGPLECYGNKVMSCVVKYFAPEDHVPMISCMLSEQYPAIEGRECADELGLNWSSIIDCIDMEGAVLLYQNGLKTQNLRPKLFYIPTTTVNDFYNKAIWRKTLRNLPGVVCATYLKKFEPSRMNEIPHGCKVKIQVYFRALDDDMKRFFSKEAEEFWRIFRRISRIEFLPVKYLPEYGVYEDCSHNKCYSKKVLACVMKLHSTDVQMEFIACIMSQDDEKAAFKTCSSEVKIPFDEINNCALSRKSLKYLVDNQENFLRVRNPSKKFPLIVVGKVVLQNETEIQKYTCLSFHGLNPPECKGVKQHPKT